MDEIIPPEEAAGDAAGTHDADAVFDRTPTLAVDVRHPLHVSRSAVIDASPAQIWEAITDPGDNATNAWYDRRGYEADDKCAWHNLYQLIRPAATPSNAFWVQPEYSNGGTVTASGFTYTYPGPGCVVP